MHDDDREHLVALAEALVGRGVRRHEWAWLRDDNGDPIRVDLFWPALNLAIAVSPEPFDTWRLAGAILRLREIELLVVPPAALPWDEDGRLVRDDRQLLKILGDRELVREDWDDDPDRPTRLGDYESASTDDLLESDWVLWTSRGSQSWDDVPAESWPEAPASSVVGSWRGGPILLAATEALALGRALLGVEMRGGLSAPQLQVLAAIVAADYLELSGAGGAQEDTPSSLAHRLGLPVLVVRGAVQALQDGALVTVESSEPSILRPTAAGREAIEGWVSRIAPRFGRWPRRTSDTDDAG